MLDNCFRFAPRDSIPGLIAKICKYLKDHPGWSEEELEDQIKKFISATGVESFNGRTGTVTLDKNDVNNLKIASAYFAEGNESIDSLDIVSLYNQGVRFVFTDFNSVTSGYNLAFVLDYFSGSGEVVYYPMSTGSGGGGNIVSVNGKTGVVELSLADIVGTSGVQVKLCTAEEFASTNTVAWNAYYNEGYRIVGVVNASAMAIDSIYLLKQDENNHTPIGLSTGSSDAYTPSNPPPYPVSSVNGKTGAVTGLYDQNNQPPYPVISVNGKTGAVTGLYDQNNQPPYPVTSVNGKTGAVTGLYDQNNQPPYPVTSVNGKTGDVNIINIVTLDPLIANQTFTITKGLNIVRLIRVIDAGSSIPPGNTSTRTATISSDYAINILGLSLQNNAYDAQCTAYMDGSNIGFVLTNHSGEGMSMADIYCNALIYTDEDSVTISF